MRLFRTSSVWRAGLTLAMLLWMTLSSCSSRVPMPVDDPSPWVGQSKIFLVLTDGSEYTVTEPDLQDATITGSFSPDDRQRVAVDEVASLSISRLDKARTIGLTLWGLAATVVLVTLLGEGKSQEPCPT